MRAVARPVADRLGDDYLRCGIARLRAQALDRLSVITERRREIILAFAPRRSNHSGRPLRHQQVLDFWTAWRAGPVNPHHPRKTLTCASRGGQASKAKPIADIGFGWRSFLFVSTQEDLPDGIAELKRIIAAKAPAERALRCVAMPRICMCPFVAGRGAKFFAVIFS
jgi:hypothetical protein